MLRGLLWCGVVGGPLFVVVFLVNDRIRDNYDPVRDFVSEAAIGPGGWVQIVNFLVTGSLFVAFGAGLSRAVSRWTGWLVIAFGAVLALSGVFVTDPAPHTVRTGHGIAHDVAGFLIFLVLMPAAAFVAARWQPAPAGGARAWRWGSRAVGVAVPVLFVLGGGIETATGVFQRLAIAVGWIWLAVLGLRALRASTPSLVSASSNERTAGQ